MGDELTLLTPRDVDRLLRWPRGRALKAARQGTLPAIVLPDGDVRFDRDELLRVLKCGDKAKGARDGR